MTRKELIVIGSLLFAVLAALVLRLAGVWI
jgi:hypothetical protein